MKNKEQSDANTSGHVGPKSLGLGQAPTSRLRAMCDHGGIACHLAE